MRDNDLSQLLRDLTAVAAPSGNEDRMIAAVVERLGGLGVRPHVDRIGNVSARFGPPGATDLMIFAHLDELGLVVRAIDATGFLRIERLGGVPERVLPGTLVTIHGLGGDLPAVVGIKAHHLTPPEEKYVARPVADLYLDAGFRDASDAVRQGVRIGDPVTYSTGFTCLAGGRAAAKSMDDRAGVAALLLLAERMAASPPEIGIELAFSVQEEFNVRGTLALAARLHPAVAVDVDVAPATDPPDLGNRSQVRLGSGPVISRLSFHGRGTLGGLVPHPAVLDGLESAAREIRIEVQRQAIVGLITDASFLPMAAAEGIAAAEVAIPVRYTHSPVETVQLSDVAATTELLEAFAHLAGGLRLDRGRDVTGGLR